MGVPALKTTSVDFYDLDELDGHAFEDVCAALFSVEGYKVKMGPRTGDKGRDLILLRDSKTTIVECKHYSGVVGRPIVQKLHSAVLTFPKASAGIIVTTGRFSEEAKEHVHEILHSTGHRIELIDFAALVARGKAVGLHFASKKRGNNIHFHIPWRSDYQATSDLNAFIASIISHPRVVTEHLLEMRIQRVVRPVVRIEYHLYREFYRSERHLYTAQADGVELYCVDDTVLSKVETQAIAGAEIDKFTEERILGVPPSSLFEAKVDEYTSRTIARLVNNYSRVVQYTGKNNHQYSAECAINASDILTSTKRVLVSNWAVTFRVSSKKYALSLMDLSGRKLSVQSNEGFRFGIGKELGSMILCNDCAQLVPIDGALWKHGHRCRDCGRTVCPDHVWYFPAVTSLSFPSYCSSCYPSKVAKNWKLYPWLSFASGLTFAYANLTSSINPDTLNILKITFLVAISLSVVRIVYHFTNVLRVRRSIPPWQG